MIQALARMKSYLDYGIPTPIQIGAIEALRGPQACVAEHVATYEARRDTLIDGLARPGPGHWLIEKPKATMLVGAHPDAAPGHGLTGVLQAAAARGQRRGLPGHRLRQDW
jgi:aspartate/methionine/tyrosine aminotransferase